MWNWTGIAKQFMRQGIQKLKNLFNKQLKIGGERGCVEQGQFDDILQTEQIANSSTTALDTTCQQTNSQVHTSEQEAFRQKYQLVEVLNSDGEWVSGYWVHKCLVVANLEGVERKWALVDELGGKYAFWGQIRLPRGGYEKS
ncbi:MAG: hypothetical protein HC820_00910 [Hydrococcus sp. RM1_1_31]|nr:hypothetical protein [Hydrococcus sp. RM1_1_31]